MKLMDKTVAITGAGTGIGRAIACRFAREGAKIAVIDINHESAETVVGDIRSTGGTAVSYRCDISDQPAVIKTMEQIMNDLGPIDILVNNAGGAIVGGKFQEFSECTDEFLHRVLGVNLYGTLYCTRAVIPEMKKLHRGKIINFASIRGIVGDKNNILYGTAKGGVIAFTKSLAMEAGPYGITVNSISPGAIASRPGPATCPTFLNRAGSCDEVAELALFLASDEGSFITGENIVIDGGRTLGARGD